MNDSTHLTPVQFDGILIGDTNPAAAEHLASCPTCTAALAGTRASLSLFGEALTNMAQQPRLHHNARPARLTPTRPIFRLTATFALAASVAIVAAVFPVGRVTPPPTVQTTKAAPAPTVQSDEALLNEIDQQLSASVPEALAPLEDPTGSQTSTSSSKSTNKKD